MALTYLDGVNRMLYNLGEDPVGSLSSGFTVAANRCKLYLNDAWVDLCVDSGWSWLAANKTLSSSGTATPDIFNVSGLSSIQSLNIIYDNTGEYTNLPITDDRVLLIGKTSIQEETLWAGSTAGITTGTVRAYGANIYTAASAGTTGTVPPTHTTGTVSDGGVNWTFSRVFSLSATPFAFSILTNTQVRLRPYPGPLALQRYYVVGNLAPTRLMNDNDVFPNLPVEFETPLINMALAIAAVGHLDDADAATRFSRLANTRLDNLRARNRRQPGPQRIRMTNYGVKL
jgi:hypothetical protein